VPTPPILMAVKRIFNPPPVAVCRLIEVVAPVSIPIFSTFKGCVIFGGLNPDCPKTIEEKKTTKMKRKYFILFCFKVLKLKCIGQ